IQYDEATGENKIGLIDKQGEEVIPPQYDEILDLGDQNGYVVAIDQKFGIYDPQGKELLPPILDNVMIPGNTLELSDKGAEFPLLALLDNRYFYLTKSGDILTLITDTVIEFREPDEQAW